MLIIKSVSELLSRVESLKSKGESIGLVPTMGALHKGHLSLVKKSKERDDVTIVSVFVNPIQFNNPQDLLTYPRTPEEDAQQLAKENVDILFMPTEEEMTAEAEVAAKTFRLGSVAEVMEGKFRPGHFQGVAYIVNRLFQLCRPTRAYFGMKDFQQIAVIRELVRSEGLDVEIVACPIVREESGLALSSRNKRLSSKMAKEAAKIYETLQASKEFTDILTIAETRQNVIDKLNAIEHFRVEYFDIVDGETLLPVEEWNEAKYVVGCITVYVSDVRLIDNIVYKGEI